MCGINGFVQFRYIRKKSEMSAIVHDMNNRIIHRGPDREGLYSDESCSIGMRRLSVIDLITGSQPIFNENRTKAIVFNGELYNFKELREGLERKGIIFRTKSDTEVVLKGIESQGVSFLNKMEGMFAFCIYDIEKREWILARDRLGEKPLYYYKNENYFIFGSELKSLLGTGLIKKTIDSEALTIYFQLTYIPAPMCIISGVKKLEQGSYIILKQNGEIIDNKYWHLEADDCERLYRDYSYAKKRLRDLLTISVEKRMISDVPIGAFLSGGFDSSTIVGIMSRLSSTPIDTFTIEFDERENDESELAALVAKKNGTKHHRLKLNWAEAEKNIDSVLFNVDEPFADNSLISTYAVSKLTGNYVTVALTGDGGDELFAGYSKYLISYYSNIYNKIPVLIRKNLIEKSISYFPFYSSFYRKAKKVIDVSHLDKLQQKKHLMSLGFKKSELEELMVNNKNISNLEFISEQYNRLGHRDDQTRTQYIDLITVLEGQMLAKVDRASMLASLETRVPMLDSNVIDFAFSLPTEYRIKGKKGKRILKDAFKDLYPPELFKAPKHGFGVPIGQWLEGSLKNKLLQYSDKKYLESQGIFDAEYFSKIVSRHMTHKENRYGELWTFFVFQNWYKNYMEK